MGGLQAVTVLTICSSLLLGLLLALLAGLKEAAGLRPETGLAPIRGRLFRLNLALIPLFLLGGVLVDLFGVRAMIVAGALLLAIVLLCFCVGVGYARSTLGILALAVAGCLVAPATLVLMPRAFFGTRHALASLNLGLVFVALGALIGVSLLHILYRWLEFPRTMAFLAVLALVVAGLAVFPERDTLEGPAIVADHGEEAGPPTLAGQALDRVLVLADPALWLACLACFVYMPLETTVSVWASDHLPDAVPGQRLARQHLLVFWGAFLLARLLLGLVPEPGFLAEGTYRGLYLFFSPMLIAVLLGSLAGAPTREHAWWSMFFLGALFGPLFPTLLAAVAGLTSVREGRGLALGTLLAAGSLGGALLGWMVVRFRGTMSATHHVSRVLLMPLFLSLLLMVAMLAFWLMAV
jgi:hypothetical protein